MQAMIKVLATGSFDPLHKGHIFYLKEAKKLGDKLYVIVSSDEKIRKNKHREPRQGQKVRAQGVRSLKIVDKVIIGEGEQFSLIDKINPDIIALGYDQKIPEPLKNKVKQYKIITLKPYRPEIYKSSLISK